MRNKACKIFKVIILYFAKEIITLEEVSSYEEGKNLVPEGKVAALVYVLQNFTKDYLNNGNINIKLIGDNTKSDDVSIVNTILNSFKRYRVNKMYLYEKENIKIKYTFCILLCIKHTASYINALMWEDFPRKHFY